MALAKLNRNHMKRTVYTEVLKKKWRVEDLLCQRVLFRDGLYQVFHS